MFVFWFLLILGNSVGFCAYCCMEKHINTIFNPRSRSVRPMFVRHLRAISKVFRQGAQEDSHEFLVHLIDKMQDASVRQYGFMKDEEYKTEIFSILGGYVRSRVICSRCKHKSDTYDAAMTLCLDIGKSNSLVGCLSKYVAKEILSKNNEYKCESCDQLSNASKQLTIHR